MSNFMFPTLESLAEAQPKAQANPLTGWVSDLRVAATAPAVECFSWAPPGVETLIVAPVVEDTSAADIQEAIDEGFRQGYADGLMSGTERGTVEGRREGMEQVLTEQRAQIAAFGESLERVVETVDPAIQRWKEAVEVRATELAMKAVRSLLAAELSIAQPEAMGIVRQALGHAEGAIHATIRLSLADRAALAERQDEILAACAGLRSVELVDDPSITGGCMIETENGVVDATLATRLSLWEAA